MEQVIEELRTPPPAEVFPPWPRAQREVHRLARETPPPLRLLRTTGLLRPDVADRIAEWFTGPLTADAGAVRASYGALERDTRRLSEIIHRDRRDRGLGVRVDYVHAFDDPYENGAELCAELRRHGSMKLRTIACDEPHPLLGGKEGGVVDQLRIVHDVFGHAALGVGFDLQSELAAWHQCRTLFSVEARSAAFCELVGAVTAYVATGEKPVLRADLPPAELIAAAGATG